eukprot:TRINITY_DN12405_c0_g1_i1.p3 TRINITY_DN12405_c0_g1~~TRINITY_DN12405_c0_g1_i1.p3  ORF type:complete len:133 (+),score=51.66 TRINITY_DN12405_c0_g1_i1:77-475(+)
MEHHPTKRRRVTGKTSEQALAARHRDEASSRDQLQPPQSQVDDDSQITQRYDAETIEALRQASEQEFIAGEEEEDEMEPDPECEDAEEEDKEEDEEVEVEEEDDDEDSDEEIFYPDVCCFFCGRSEELLQEK